MSTARVSPGVLAPLQDALSAIYWFKNDLRTFLDAAVGDRSLIASLDFNQVKRQVVRDLVTLLAADQHKYFDNLVNLILAVSEVSDPVWLKRQEDGDKKYREAVEAVNTLCLFVEPYRAIRSEAEQRAKRRQVELSLAQSRQAVTDQLQSLNTEFSQLSRMDPQPRGYALEKLLTQLFILFDIDATEAFRIRGEQIDGAFTLQSAEYLLEAKWQTALTPLSDLDTFVGKIRRKLDNTLGFFLSMNGFQPNAVTINSQGGRPLAILMDGSDLAVVLDNRISLPDLLVRKRQHAARTGETFVSGWTLLG